APALPTPNPARDPNRREPGSSWACLRSPNPRIAASDGASRRNAKWVPTSWSSKGNDHLIAPDHARLALSGLGRRFRVLFDASRLFLDLFVHALHVLDSRRGLVV